MRIAFVGAVEGSLVAFEALLAASMPPVLLVTLPAEAGSRHSDFVDLTAPAVAAGIAVHRTTSINAAETIAALEAARPDVTMVVGWSQLCREPFRRVAAIGTLGFHPAPLPRFRGRAVIPWTILAGEQTSGATFFWLDDGVDTGPILVQRLFDVSPDETARTLYDKHKRALAELAPLAVAKAMNGAAGGTPQDDSLASVCAKRTAADGAIDWSQPADTILRLVRAVGDPYPGAFTHHCGQRLVVDSARPHHPKGRFIGLPGQVQVHTDAGFAVLCGDGSTIEATRWRCETGIRPKVHAQLTAR